MAEGGMKMPKNVEIHGGSIRLVFHHEGKRCRESLGIPPTAGNIAAAGVRLRKLEKDIARGAFNYSREFPDSLRVKRAAEQARSELRTFGQACDRYIKTISGRSDATKSQYGNALIIWRQMFGEDTPITEMEHGDIAEKIGEYPWAGPKLKNNYLIPLRGVFRMEYPGKKKADNPMNEIENDPVTKTIPDPLSIEERDEILEHMRASLDIRVWAYFAWMFSTGMRPEEAIALRWSDIDKRRNIARVRRVRTFKGGERDGTKTNTERDVLLTPAALSALSTMAPLTKLKGGDIFENPDTGRAWHDDRMQREKFWHPTLAALEIRARRAYCTRHTCASAALMMGVNPSFMAGQLGHSTRMFLDTYATWIKGRHDPAQLALLALASAPAPKEAAAPNAAPMQKTKL